MTYRVEHEHVEQTDTEPDDVVIVPRVIDPTPPPPLMPPPQPAPVLRDVVYRAPIHQTATTDAVRATTQRRFAPDAVIAASVGVALLLFGLIALVRAGLDGPNSVPVVQVLGFDHTASLGLVEIAFGLGLLLTGSFASRSGALFFGSVLAIGAFVAAVEAESFRDEFAIESGFAWLLVAAGVLVVLSSLLVPRVARTTQSSTTVVG